MVEKVALRDGVRFEMCRVVSHLLSDLLWRVVCPTKPWLGASSVQSSIVTCSPFILAL